MGLDLESIVSQAFSAVSGAVDGVVDNATYKATNGAPSYNATTGAITQPLSDIPVRVIRKKLTIKDQLAGGVYGIPGFQIKTDDRVYLIPRADLGRMPTNKDKLQLSTGEIFNVEAFGADPRIEAALITVVVRKP